MSDPIDLVRQVVPPVEAPSELLERVRSDLMTTIAQSDTPSESTDEEQRSRRHKRHRWAVPIAAAAVLTTAGTAAAGWAVLGGGDSSTSTSIQCPNRDHPESATIINAVTGDPVADCADVWQDLYDTAPPPMTAYDNGEGGVTVLLDGAPVPDGYVALEPGPYQDTDLIELEAALDDSGSGLTSNCFDEAGARDVVQRELDRLGLTGWAITVDEGRPPAGSASCAYFVVRPEEGEVQLIGMGQAPSEAGPYRVFARELEDRLSAECVGLEEAADIVRDLAANTDVSSMTDYEFTEESGLLNLQTVEDLSATCTRADVNVGGAVKVTLRGPAS